MLIVALVSVIGISSIALAQDHKCVAYCDGDPAPSRGGGGRVFVAPEPLGPSPAQLAAQRQRAAALAHNNRAIALQKKGKFAEAVRAFEEALRLQPNDNVIHANVLTAKGQMAFFDGDYQRAAVFYEQSLEYDSNAAPYTLGAA